MNDEIHVNGAVSALVMLAAIVSVYTTYSYYNDQKIADQYDENRAGLEQAASALVSLHQMQTTNETAPAATSTSTSTKKADSKDATKNAASVNYAF